MRTMRTSLSVGNPRPRQRRALLRKRHRSRSTPRHSLALLTPAFKAKKSDRVVVEDVSLLLRGQVIGFLDRFDRLVNLFGPSHLVGAKHQALPEAGANESLDISVKRSARDDPRNRRQIAVELRILIHHGDHLVEERVTAILDEHSEFPMSNQHLLEEM